MFEQKFFTVQELSSQLQCDDETVLAAIHRGDLEALNVAKDPDGRRPSWRIPELCFLRWCKARSSKRGDIEDVIPMDKEVRRPPRQIV